MSKTVINPPTLAKPTGYSYAIKKSGTPVFISGQVALDAEGKLVGENDAAAQTEQVLQESPGRRRRAAAAHWTTS